MKKARRIAASSIVFASIVPVAAAQTPLSVEQWREDLRHFEQEMPRVHRNLYHTITPEAFAQSVSDLSQRLPDLERHEVVVELARVAASIADGHTGLWLRDREAVGFRRYPIFLHDFDDGLFLIAAEERHAEAVGGRVVRIGSMPVAKAWSRVSELVSRDNDMGIRNAAPRYLAVPEILHALEIVEDMEHATLTVRVAGGDERTIGLQPTTADVLPPFIVEAGRYGDLDMVTMLDTAPRPLPLYMRHPQTPQAVALYQRALSMDPQGPVGANASRMLRRLHREPVGADAK